MNDIIPQIVFTPDQLLSINVNVTDRETTSEIVQEYLDAISSWTGVSVSEDNGIARVDIDINQAPEPISPQDDGELDRFVSDLSRLLPFTHPDTATDQVASVEWLSRNGANGIIHPSFIWWLEAEGISEIVARDCINAMATLFEPNVIKHAKNSFVYRGNGASDGRFIVALRDADFEVYKPEETEDSFVENNGRVTLKWVDLTTLGSCACWGLNGDSRRISLGTSGLNTIKLYELKPHNIDSSRQALSLLLGLGSLAHYASQLTTHKDIDVFSEVQWGESRVFPKSKP